MSDDLDHVKVNQESWTKAAVDFFDVGRESWAGEPSWGIWRVPESEVGMLPDVQGKDTLELGCGTGYVSAWLARRGGRPVGIDPTWAQLHNAISFQNEFDLHFPLLLGIGEKIPFADETFDVVISEYGASIWADPYQWIPEAARVLRPGGELTFLVGGTILMLCVPDSETDAATAEMIRDYFGMYRFEWSGDDDGIEFHLGYGEWIRLLRANGFEVEDLIEVRPPADATTRYPFVTHEWARRWPSEEIWRARKT